MEMFGSAETADGGSVIDRYAAMFGMPQEIRTILYDGMVTDAEDIITLLEVYKFYSRDKVVSVLNKHNVGGVHPFTVLEDYEPHAEYSRYESKYGVLISDRCKDSVDVYVPGMSSVNVNQLELDFSTKNVAVRRITPHNFRTAEMPSYRPRYDALIMFKRILLEALRLGATDLHFDVKHVGMEPRYSVSCRVGTDLREIDLFQLDSGLNREIIGKLVENKTSAASVDLNDAGGITASASNILGNGSVELRIGANRVKDGFHYVIRIQCAHTFSFRLADLGFHENVLRDLEQIVEKRSGITLVTGAVRTGKNTTVFAIANEMMEMPVKMVSYESPIEVLMPMTQVEYADNVKILVNAVRLAKKQDINVAFLNEIPDKEVAFAVQDLVNSSIHVVTTMHMDRLWHLPYKLREYYGEDYKNLISQLNGVFNQKMFGINCPHCREEVLVADIKNSVHRDFLLEAGLVSAVVTRGCGKCGYTGSAAGRNQPYSEHLLFSPELKDRMLRCQKIHEIEIALRDEVMHAGQNMEQYILQGIRSGDLSVTALNSVL